MTVTSNRQTVNSAEPESGTLQRAAEILLSGGLVVGPTETRYALLARADSESAVRRLYDAKGRPEELRCAVFVASHAELAEIAELTPQAKALAERLLPGPLTLILKRNQRSRVELSPLVSDGASVGVRFSSCPFITELIKLVSVPLTATSANRSGAGERTSIKEIQTDLGSSVELYCDAGELRAPVSTVVDFTGHPYRILREGTITATQIQQALQD